MIEKLKNAIVDDSLDAVEILDHSARRPATAKRSANGDLEAVRMSMDARTLSRMERQRVRGLESEAFANLRLKLSLRSHRFEVTLERGQETASDVTVDDAMIE